MSSGGAPGHAGSEKDLTGPVERRVGETAIAPREPVVQRVLVDSSTLAPLLESGIEPVLDTDRLLASGIRPLGGQTAHLSIGKSTGEETVAALVEFDISAPEDSPKVYEFEVYLDMPATRETIWRALQR